MAINFGGVSREMHPAQANALGQAEVCAKSGDNLKANSGWVVAAGIAVALLLTAVGWNVASNREFERNQDEFAAIANDNEEALFHRMATYRTALDGAAALFLARDEVTFPEWENYVSTLDLELSLMGLNGIGFIRNVDRREQDDFLVRARQRGAPIEAIHPASERQELLPIKYIVPLENNRPALGLDLAFETNRREALLSSRLNGELTITKPITLVQDQQKGTGFLLLRPIYRNGALVDTEDRRLAAFEGWSYAPLMTREFLANLTPRQGSAFDISIYQGDAVDPAQLIYSSADAGAATYASKFVRTSQIVIAAQPWTIEWRSLPEFENTVKSDEPLLVLAGGIAISLCLGALLITLSRREAQVRRKVAEATRALAARDQERTIMLEDLRRARDQSLAAVKAKSTFLANMSHELRTPMNGVLGFADLLVRSDLAPEPRRHAELIAESGRVMARLLDDILDLSRIEAGKMVIAHESLDPKRVCRHVLQLVEPAARDKGLDVTLRLGEAIPHLIVGDKLRIQQILINLVGNAVKFTDSGFVSIKLQREDDELVFVVRDSGIGIEAAKLEAIFDDFVQADDGASRQRGGTGLGLSISLKLARSMGGSLSATSSPGAGSTFTLKLPLRVAATRPVDRHNTANRHDERDIDNPSKARILMAEDNDINRILMEAMALEAGVELDCAFDGKQAVAMVEHAALNDMPFDLILMDVQMPVMDGIEATGILRDRGFAARDLPIVALTANAFAEDVERCLGAGMQAHYAKPLTLEKFKDLLARWLPDPDGRDRAAA